LASSKPGGRSECGAFMRRNWEKTFARCTGRGDASVSVLRIAGTADGRTAAEPPPERIWERYSAVGRSGTCRAQEERCVDAAQIAARGKTPRQTPKQATRLTTSDIGFGVTAQITGVRACRKLPTRTKHPGQLATLEAHAAPHVSLQRRRGAPPRPDRIHQRVSPEKARERLRI